MASITTWMRLEPHSRASDMEAGLEMRVHDPLWMLARQWQFGEFQGEDTGSPVWAAYSGEEMPIALYLPGPIDGHTSQDVQEYTAKAPLEYLLEREQPSASAEMDANRRLAVEAGEQFLRQLGKSLADKYRAVLVNAFAFLPVTDEDERKKIDDGSLAFLDWMADRAVDGSRLLAALAQAAPGNYAALLGLDPADTQAANQAVVDWLSWCEKMIGPVAPAGPTRSAWNPERMEYSCALAAPVGSTGDQLILQAGEYRGGHLDWYSFDAILGQKLNHAISNPGNTFDSEDNSKEMLRTQSDMVLTSTVPTSISFRGMPANRLWEFEDAQVRFGSIQAAPTDLARMLLVEFLIAYGNDFFTIPIGVKAGSLFQIQSLTVTNTFGDITQALPFADQAWRMFALSTNPASQIAAPGSMLFVPPVVDQSLESPPLEQVLLLRDEMANMAWAVEQVVGSKSGKPLNRHEAFQARRRREADTQNNPPPAGGSLVYRLDTWQSTLPEYWFPLLPELTQPGQSPMRLACLDPQGNIQGRLLAELVLETQPSLFDQEVPRAGAQVKRGQQYTRWYDGGLFAWTGREKRPGRGEGSSGLRNDVVDVVKPA